MAKAESKGKPITTPNITMTKLGKNRLEGKGWRVTNNKIKAKIAAYI
jgi:hypothetical protein